MTDSADTTSAETISTETTSTEPTSTESTAAESTATESGPASARPTSARPASAQSTSARSTLAGGPARRPVSPEEWRRLRAPFSRKAYIVDSRATGRTAANLPLGAYSGTSSSEKPSSGNEEGESLNQSVVDLRLRPEAIRDRLDLVLSPGRYGYRLEPGPEAGGTFSMRCHLRVGPGRRTGVGTASSLRMAGGVALASAAEAFGMGTSGKVAGPVMADNESWHRLPGPVLERLEQREEPAPWTPGEEPLGGEEPLEEVGPEKPQD